MTFRYIILILGLFCSTFELLAQPSIKTPVEEDLYQKAYDLFIKEQYGASRELFEQYLQGSENALKAQNAEYYIAISSIYLYHSDGEANIKNFVKQYPTHPRANTAYFELANFYYKEKNYAKAIQYYEETDRTELKRDDQTEYDFRIGYSYFTRKAFGEAATYFDRLKRTNNAYTAASSYYAGFIAFQQEEYSQALYDLEKASASDAYRSAVAPIIANIYYRQKNYDKLIEYGESLMQEDGIPGKEDIYLLIGDALYYKKDYEQAVDFFNEYLTTKRTDPEREVLYRIAFTQYIAGTPDEAIASFKKVTTKNDTLTQFSAYYLGKLYVEEGNNTYALNAFEQAKLMPYDAAIQEQAHYQLAKLYIKLERYAEAIREMQSFQEKYPSSAKASEVNELLSEAYLNTSNYDLAIEFIEGLGSKTLRVQEAYQKVTLYKGMELFNKENFFQAVQFFQKSAEFPVNKDLVGEAYYWIGESYSVGKKYEEALEAYDKAFAETSPDQKRFHHIQYGNGYALYNTKSYKRALSNFKGYVEAQPRLAFYDDALIRLADCYYVTKAYNIALDTYEKAIRERSADVDYAYFQKGVIYSILSQADASRKHFDVVLSKYKSSLYYDNAVFQKALLEFEQGNYQAAIAGFSQLIDEQQQSALIPFALSKRAIAYYNLQQYKKTEADYKRILDQFLTHQVANSALLGLQEVMNVQGKTGEMEAYISAYKTANPQDKEVATIEFESAKSYYFNGDYDKAIASFKGYQKAYPDNAFSDEANFYLGDSYYRLQQYEEAIRHFTNVVNENNTGFVLRSVQKLAEINFETGNYQESGNYFSRLVEMAQNKKHLYIGWSGLMEIALMDSNYEQVKEYADLILEKASVNVNAVNKAYVYKGLANYRVGNYADALTQFENAVNSAKDEYSAEAKYRIAEIQYNQQDFKTSLETLFDLNKEYASYDEWIGKSFLLIADNYVKLDEVFQAKATLNSIIENAANQRVVLEAKNKLKEIEKLEAEAEAEQQATEDSLNNANNQMMMETDTTQNEN